MLKLTSMPEFVLPTSLTNKYGDEISRLTLQREMFELFCPDARIWLICPRRDTQGIKNVLGTGMYTYLEDEEVLKHRHRNGGWMTQQMIKLEMSRHVTTPFFITLDSDVFPTRRLLPSYFVRNNRGLFNYRKSDNPYVNEAVGVFDTPGVETLWEVTPLVYSRNAWRTILDYIGPDWHERLSVLKDWREHAVYQHGMRDLGLLDKYHVEAESYLCRFIVAMPQLTADLFTPHSCPLLCVHSDNGIYPKYIRDRLCRIGILK